MTHYLHGHVLSIGTISHATLRSQDLIVAFCSEIRKYRTTLPNILLEAEAWLEGVRAYMDQQELDTCDYHECGSELVEGLMNHLSDMAPEGVYFGNTEGDGSDFGWWEVEE